MGDGSSFTTIADNSANSPFEHFNNPGINDSGMVAFSATLKGGGEGVFPWDGTMLITIADTTDPASPFDGFDQGPPGFGYGVDINNSGVVAFGAHRKDGGNGIYTGFFDPLLG